MLISYHRYELTARIDGRFREGALLRVDFYNGLVGYSDLHPWPELGDADLDQQLDRLGEASLTPLLERSLAFARQDAEARAEARSLFDGLRIPKSHYSLPYGFNQAAIQHAVAGGYDIVKLKSWDFTPSEVEFLQDSGLKFRLDFNNKLTFEEASERLESWRRVTDLDWIDLIEDPCLYDHGQWQRLRDRFQIRVALDRRNTPLLSPDIETSYDVLIHKPAIETFPEALMRQRATGQTTPIVVTSYLDHPVGQSFAAYQAALALAKGHELDTCGLVTHSVYTDTPFTARLAAQQGVLIPSSGTGIGFDEELESLTWADLES